MLPADARERLVKIAGLMTSDQDGERASAAAKATALLRQHGLTWRDALFPPAAKAPPPPPPSGVFVYQTHRWQDYARLAHANRRLLNEFEKVFAESLVNRWKPPSAKQHEILERMCAWLAHRGVRL